MINRLEHLSYEVRRLPVFGLFSLEKKMPEGNYNRGMYKIVHVWRKWIFPRTLEFKVATQ